MSEASEASGQPGTGDRQPATGNVRTGAGCRLPVSCFVFLILLTSPAEAKSLFEKFYADGQEAFNLGEHDRAQAMFERARELEPRKPGPHRWLGRLARLRQDWEACVESSTEAIRLRPNSPLLAEVKSDRDACREMLNRPNYAFPLSEGQGALSIIADVAGAPVTIDGIKRSPTPIPPLPLNKGKHVVEVTSPAGSEIMTGVRVEIDVVPGITVDVVVRVNRH